MQKANAKKRGRSTLEEEKNEEIFNKRLATSETTFKATSNSNSQPLGTTTAVLSLIEKSFIESRTCKKKNRMAIKLFQENQINDILVKIVPQEQETIEIKGLVSESYRIIFQLQSNKNIVPTELKLKNAKCNCNSFLEKDLCEHIISILYYIYHNGASSIEELDDVVKLLKNHSHEELIDCLKFLVGKRPEILPIIKEKLTNKNQHNSNQPTQLSNSNSLI